MASDGQVTMGDHVLKHTARKIRRLYQDKILAGFAGSTADAFSLFARFETKLEQYAGNLNRAAVELAKDWRTDKMLRNLEALLVVADAQQTFLISGSGDVIDPDESIAAIGSGGSYATAAARALIQADRSRTSISGGRGFDLGGISPAWTRFSTASHRARFTSSAKSADSRSRRKFAFNFFAC